MTAPVDLDALERWLAAADGPSHYRLLAALPLAFAELRTARQDAARWQWWQQHMTVARDEPGEWTCWIEIPCIPTRSQTTSAAELTDAFIERFPLDAAIAKGTAP